MKDSYIHIMFEQLVSNKLYSNPEQSLQNIEAPQWTALPQKLWVYWDKNIDDASLTTQIAYEGMKKQLEATNIEVIMVTPQNIQDYIGAELKAQIIKVFEITPYQMYQANWSDAYRLALLIKHGGIYIDLSTFLLEDLSWIVNIARRPSHHIYNRYGQLPKVLMSFYPYSGSPGTWTFDKEHNTKS